MPPKITQESVFTYLDNTPTDDNNVLYKFYKCETINEKTLIRQYKSLWKKSKKKNLQFITEKKKDKFLKLPLRELVKLAIGSKDGGQDDKQRS